MEYLTTNFELLKEETREHSKDNLNQNSQTTYRGGETSAKSPDIEYSTPKLTCALIKARRKTLRLDSRKNRNKIVFEGVLKKINGNKLKSYYFVLKKNSLSYYSISYFSDQLTIKRKIPNNQIKIW